MVLLSQIEACTLGCAIRSMESGLCNLFLCCAHVQNLHSAIRFFGPALEARAATCLVAAGAHRLGPGHLP